MVITLPERQCSFIGKRKQGQREVSHSHVTIVALTLLIQGFNCGVTGTSIG
jgi:hypothetical protein